VSALSRGRAFLEKHSRRLWWIHSLYALCLGAGVIAFAQRGFDHARWLAVSLGGAWVLVVVLFRVFDRRRQAHEAAEGAPGLRFYAMTYVLKNLYQGMLFFLLPFYWRSATLGTKNVAFPVLLAAFAALSTLDIVFDRWLMRVRWAASLFHGFTLFACLNLVVPALVAETRTLTAMLIAAATAVLAFWTVHVPAASFRRQRALWALVPVTVLGGMLVVNGSRAFIPPVPAHVGHGAIGPKLLPDGRLAMEVTSLHSSVIQELEAVTDVVLPGGKGDRLHHVWRREGVEVHRAQEATARVDGPEGTVRLKSSLEANKLPTTLAGLWTVDVETEDGQLVGRTAFRVVD